MNDISHIKYQTVNHYHIDFMTNNGYPNSALMIVECEDGRFFLEQEFGDEYSQFMGVLKTSYDIETKPVFYSDLKSAAEAAFKIIKIIYPDTPEHHLIDFLNEE